MVQQLSASTTVAQDLSFIPIIDAVELQTIHLSLELHETQWFLWASIGSC